MMAELEPGIVTKQSIPNAERKRSRNDSEGTLTRLDLTSAATDSKRTAALLRDARAALRRLDTLATTALTADDPAVALVAEARRATERLVEQLARREQAGQRRARQAARRGGGTAREQ
jgi:hypothetical protein